MKYGDMVLPAVGTTLIVEDFPEEYICAKFLILRQDL